MLKMIKGSITKDKKNRQYFIMFREKFIGKYLFIRKVKEDIYEYFLGDENTIVDENVKKYKITSLVGIKKRGNYVSKKVKGVAYFSNDVKYEYAVIDYIERKIYFFTDLVSALKFIISKFTNPELINFDIFKRMWESYYEHSSKFKSNIKKFVIVFISYSEIFGLVYDVNKFIKYFFLGNKKRFFNYVGSIQSRYVNIFKNALKNEVQYL